MQLPPSSSFRPVESPGARRSSLPGLPGSSIGPDAVSLSMKVCEDDVICVTMEAQLSQDVLIGEEKALITFVCMANSDDVVDNVSIRLACPKGVTPSMGAPSSTTLSPQEDAITQVLLQNACACVVFNAACSGVHADGPWKDQQEGHCEVQSQAGILG